jgi:hypothetical protein
MQNSDDRREGPDSFVIKLKIINILSITYLIFMTSIYNYCSAGFSLTRSKTVISSYYNSAFALLNKCSIVTSLDQIRIAKL